MTTHTFAKKVLWLHRRARRLLSAFPKDITNNKQAVYVANLDWIHFNHPAALKTVTPQGQP